jgi:hypothetical protein
LLFKSQHLPSLDTRLTFGRVLIVLPGKKFDQWFMISRPTDELDGGLKEGGAFSLVSVQKQSASGEELNQPVVRFQDFWRVWDKGKPQISTRLAEGRGLENCYRCHKTGVLGLNPKPDFKPASLIPGTPGPKLVDEINLIAKKYGNSRVDQIDSRAFGPAIGPVGAQSRDDSFFKSCAKDLSRDSYPRIRKAMDCASCHDGNTKGILNWPMGLEDVKIFSTFTRDRMPPHSKLTPDEKLALTQCLLTEYYGPDYDKGPRFSPSSIYGSWLQPKNCPSSAGQLHCVSASVATTESDPRNQSSLTVIKSLETLLAADSTGPTEPLAPKPCPEGQIAVYGEKTLADPTEGPRSPTSEKDAGSGR